MKLNFIITGASVAAITLALAACGSPESSGDVADAASEADTATAEESSQIEMTAPVASAPSDPIRGPGGLEEKCLARVKQETGAPSTSTNSIEESEAAIEVYVNVEGADAPWKCLGNRDGSIEEVMFTGSEGAA